MRSLLFVVLAATACQSTKGTYVADVCQQGTQLMVVLCDLASNGEADQDTCHLVPVGPPPTESVVGR